MDNNDNAEFEIRISAKAVLVFSIITGMIIMAGGAALFFDRGHFFSGSNSEQLIMVPTASAAEIYPQFVCTCCGKPLDKNNMCCGIAEDMIAYIDSQVDEGLSESEVVLATVKKYGLKALASETKKEEVKELLAKNAPADSPKIDIEPLSYDFGDVSQATGVVSQSFLVKNVGKSDLEINNLLTSCGCTSASIVLDGQEGPRFAMHNNPKNWVVTIKPEATAVLKVYYDPDVHPEFRGLATREITIFSNDAVDFEKSVKIRLNQVD